MTKIIYTGRKPYKMIIRNVEYLLYEGNEIDVNLKKIKGKKMRHFDLVSKLEEKVKEKQYLKELEDRVKTIEEARVVTPI